MLRAAAHLAARGAPQRHHHFTPSLFSRCLCAKGSGTSRSRNHADFVRGSCKWYSSSSPSSSAGFLVASAASSAGNGGGRRRIRRVDSALFSDAAAAAAAPAAAAEKHEFQAETRQLLDIVTHSIYTDKEVFLRELISNASDAMEKLRHVQVVGEEVADAGFPLEILITADEKAKTLTIEDRGIGMTKDDLVSNLGTIARSGSKAFVNELKSKGGSGSSDAIRDIIGQFGLGFYSAFMVGDQVDVLSRSYKGGQATIWSSDGSGQYSVKTLPDGAQTRGCKIVIHLKEGNEEFAQKQRVESIIKKYSNFVNVPIKLNDKPVNTVEAIWTKMPNEVDDKQHTEFYQFIAHAFDEPLDRLHFRTDAPLDLKALFYIPSFHTEKFGMGRMEPGVSLYSRRVLIESKVTDLLPDWLRFVKGVVDSEDLPLSISREKPQDSALLRKIGDVLTRKIVRNLQDMMKKDPEKYKEKFFKEYGFFIKEGICQDYGRQADLAKLLYFESSKAKAGELVSLDEYVGRLGTDQKEIYYLAAPKRDLAESSPYFETFRKNDREVLFVYNPIDEFVMVNLKNYNGRNIVSAEGEDIKLGGEEEAEDGAGLSTEEAQALCEWFKTTLSDKVADVKTTRRLEDNPAIVASHESGSLRRMMRMVEQQNLGGDLPLPKQKLEVNPSHPIMVHLNEIRDSKPEEALLIAEQIYDNALVTAGIMDDSRTMVPRVNSILLNMLTMLKKGASEAK